MSLYTSLRTIVTARGGQPAARSAPPAAPEPRLLEGLDLEQIRYPGEIDAARRLRKIKGFKTTARSRATVLTIHPVRHSSLLGATRLEPSSAPRLFGALGAACALLGVDESVEVYQEPGSINAGMSTTERGPLLTLQGPVLEVFNDLELRGMLGHELGHYLCHSRPGARFREASAVSLSWMELSAANSTEDEERSLFACALSIAQEITADRFELLVSQELGAYLTAALKFGTELSDAVLRHDPQVLLRQVREALDESTGPGELRTTHPERHIRVRAAELFFESDLFHRLTGKGSSLHRIDDVNEQVARLLAGFVPHGATSIDQQRFEQFLLAAATAIASADGAFRKEEREFLARTLPSAWHGKLLSRPERVALMEAFAEEVKRSNDVRARLTTLNFLCGLVDADGRSRDAELVAIDVVGRALDARALFRHELESRYGFDPAAAASDRDEDSEDAVRDATRSLLRFLDTVVMAGSRTATLRKLLRLGGYGRRSVAALERLRAVLEASGVATDIDLRKARVDEPLSLRAE